MRHCLRTAKLVCLLGLLVTASNAVGQDKLEHLLEAIHHLEQAGYGGQADSIRDIVRRDFASNGDQLLQRKVVELEKLQDEIALLQSTSDATPQVCLRFRVFQVASSDDGGSGLGLLSISSMLRTGTPTCLVDETGKLVEFMELLQLQGVLQLRHEPSLIVSQGREAAIAIDGPANRKTAASKAVKITCIAKAVEQDKAELSLDVNIRASSDADVETEEATPVAVAAPFRAKVDTVIPFGQTAILCGTPDRAEQDLSKGVVVLITASRPDFATKKRDY